MGSNLDATRLKVQQILADNLNGVELRDNGFTVRNGSAQIFIVPSETDDGKVTFVRVEVPVLFDLTPSPELFEWIAFNGGAYRFGAFTLFEPDEDGKTILVFRHSLLGDYLDEMELMHVVHGLASVGDEIDDELQKKFGGKRFHED